MEQAIEKIIQKFKVNLQSVENLYTFDDYLLKRMISKLEKIAN